MNWKSMACRRLTTALAKYCDDPALLPEHQRRTLEVHLAACGRCREQMETVTRVGTLLRAHVPPPTAPGADLWTRIETQIQAEAPRPNQAAGQPRRPEPKRAPLFARGWPAAVPAGALAAVAVVGALVLQKNRHVEVATPGAANVRGSLADSLPALPSPVPSGEPGGIGSAPALARRNETPRPIPAAQTPSTSAVKAARSAAQEARLSAGLDGARRDARVAADPFRRGRGSQIAPLASVASARTRSPGPAASPKATLGRSSPTSAEPRMLALAVHPVNGDGTSRGTKARGGVPELASPLLTATRTGDPPAGDTRETLAPGASFAMASRPHTGTAGAGGSAAPAFGGRPDGSGAAGKASENGLVGRRDSSADLAATAGPGSAKVAAATARGGNGGGGGNHSGPPAGDSPAAVVALRSEKKSAAALSPTEAVTQHSRQRNLFLNYSSAGQR